LQVHFQYFVPKPVPIGSGSGENFPDQAPTKNVRIRIRSPAIKLP